MSSQFFMHLQRFLNSVRIVILFYTFVIDLQQRNGPKTLRYSLSIVCQMANIFCQRYLRQKSANLWIAIFLPSRVLERIKFLNCSYSFGMKQASSSIKVQVIESSDQMSTSLRKWYNSEQTALTLSSSSRQMNHPLKLRILYRFILITNFLVYSSSQQRVTIDLSKSRRMRSEVGDSLIRQHLLSMMMNVRKRSMRQGYGSFELVSLLKQMMSSWLTCSSLLTRNPMKFWQSQRPQRHLKQETRQDFMVCWLFRIYCLLMSMFFRIFYRPLLKSMSLNTRSPSLFSMNGRGTVLSFFWFLASILCSSPKCSISRISQLMRCKGFALKFLETLVNFGYQEGRASKIQPPSVTVRLCPISFSFERR